MAKEKRPAFDEEEEVLEEVLPVEPAESVEEVEEESVPDTLQIGGNG